MIMKKTTIAVVMGVMFTLLAAQVSNAFIAVSFATDISDGGDALLQANGTTPLAAQSLFIVYLSADNSTSGFNAADPYSPNSDIMLGTFTTDPNSVNAFSGEIFGQENVEFGAGQVQYGGQYIYIAVFDVAFASGDPNPTLADGTHYGLGGTMQVIERFGYSGTPPSPEDYGVLVIEANPIVTSSTVQAVPEPSSLALLGIGLGLVAWRRMRK